MTNAASEALAALRDQFQGQLEERVAAIRKVFDLLGPAAWQANEAEGLHRLLHSLTGSAGTFGMNSVSDVSRQLENALAAVIKTGQPPGAASWQALAHDLDRLERVAHIRLRSNAPSLAPQPPPHARPERAPLIHLVEDDLAQANFLRQVLLEHGFRVQHFADPADFSAVITARADEQPAAVVMDMMFPEGGAAGANTIAQLGLGAKAGIPVVFVSIRDELAARLAAYRAGASRYLAKPVDAAQLCDLLDDLTGRMPGKPFRVLMVDDDKAVLAFQAAVLQAAGLDVLAVSQPLETLAALQQFAPDVVLLDVYMPDANGPELAAVIREQGRYMNLPILFLSAETDMTRQLLALNLGGDDFLVKPVAPEHLVAAVTARARRARQNSETMERLRITLYEREREHLALDQHALVSIADAAGLITYANAAFCTVSGYRVEEMLGHNHNLLKSGRHPASFYRDMWTTLNSGNIWRGEICNRRKDGTFYWVSATITPFLDNEGKVYQYVSIRSDITALKESQDTLRTSKERLRRGQEFANIGTWDWNIGTGELFWSERIAALFGYAEGELSTTYENFLAAVHPDDSQAVIDAVNASIENDTPYDIEHRVVWPDGTVRWLLESGAVSRDAHGKPLQMIGVVQDIDVRKCAELALADRERFLKTLIDGIPGMVGYWDRDLRCSFSNSGYLEWFGKTKEEMRGIAMPELLGEELFRKNLPHIRAALSGDAQHFERVLTKADGRMAYSWANYIPDITDGQVRGFFVLITDISEIKLAQVQLEELNASLGAARAEAERANLAKSEFLSSMSHELRTPMNAILGFGQLMEYDDTLPAEHQDNVKEILKAGSHLLDLINEVLDLAKIESGRIELSMEGVGLQALAEDCRHLIQPIADKAGIGLSFDLPAECAVFADRVRLKQVLLNLLSNAIKYNRPDGSVRLTATAGQPGQLRIAVTDTGHGIPPERIGDLFQPFNRLGAEAGEIEGTGIGLTITRRLVDLMGGEMGVDSTHGVGSTFWLELAVGQTANVGAGQTAVENINASGSWQREARVLAIDDNPANLKLIAQVMGMREHVHLLTAHTPELGIELALAHRPDLILLDINMPGMDGYQVLKVFQASAELRHIPVVAITANAMPRDIERGKAAGFTDYLTKPLDIGHFLQVADALLDVATTLPPG